MLLEILLRDMFCNKTYPGPGVSKLCDLRLNIFALRFAHLENSVGRLRRDNVQSKVFCDVSISKESWSKYLLLFFYLEFSSDFFKYA